MSQHVQGFVCQQLQSQAATGSTPEVAAGLQYWYNSTRLSGATRRPRSTGGHTGGSSIVFFSNVSLLLKMSFKQGSGHTICMCSSNNQSRLSCWPESCQLPIQLSFLRVKCRQALIQCAATNEKPRSSLHASLHEDEDAREGVLQQTHAMPVHCHYKCWMLVLFVNRQTNTYLEDSAIAGTESSAPATVATSFWTNATHSAI